MTNLINNNGFILLKDLSTGTPCQIVLSKRILNSILLLISLLII